MSFYFYPFKNMTIVVHLFVCMDYRDADLLYWL